MYTFLKRYLIDIFMDILNLYKYMINDKNINKLNLMRASTTYTRKFRFYS